MAMKYENANSLHFRFWFSFFVVYKMEFYPHYELQLQQKQSNIHLHPHLNFNAKYNNKCQYEHVAVSRVPLCQVERHGLLYSIGSDVLISHLVSNANGQRFQCTDFAATTRSAVGFPPRANHYRSVAGGKMVGSCSPVHDPLNDVDVQVDGGYGEIRYRTTENDVVSLLLLLSSHNVQRRWSTISHTIGKFSIWYSQNIAFPISIKNFKT